jgi:UDP-glucose 4-epimerase
MVVDLLKPLQLDVVPEVDAIVHLAHHPRVSVPENAASLYRINTTSTQELLEAGRRRGAKRFLYASSGAVYGFTSTPVTESDTPAARDLYAITKLHGEELVRAYGDYLEPVILRPFFPYGPGQEGRLISNLIASVRAGEPIPLNDAGRPYCNPVYVEDAADAVVAALDGPAPNVVNVAGAEVVSIEELAAAIGRALGKEALFKNANRTVSGDLAADVTRMRALLLDRDLVTLAEGLRRTVESQKAR